MTWQSQCGICDAVLSELTSRCTGCGRLDNRIDLRNVPLDELRVYKEAILNNTITDKAENIQVDDVIVCDKCKCGEAPLGFECAKVTFVSKICPPVGDEIVYLLHDGSDYILATTEAEVKEMKRRGNVLQTYRNSRRSKSVEEMS